MIQIKSAAHPKVAHCPATHSEARRKPCTRRSFTPASPWLLLSPLALATLVAACESETGDAQALPIGGNQTAAGDKADDGDEVDGGTGGTSPDAGVDLGTPSAVDAASPAEPVGIALLGAGSHAKDAVSLELVADARHGLRTPRDLAFNPANEGELWVVNATDDSTVTFFDLHTDRPTVAKRIDPFALHFMDTPSSIAFGAPMTFGTCQESRNTYNDQAPANDFMGPSLWPADFEVYARSNPEAVAEVGSDLGSHLDMLHESPLCMGIAWEKDNVYWTFDGLSGSLSRYDFMADHGPGFDDHSDGMIWRYGLGEVARVPGVPSHLVYDTDSALLFAADTGNARIVTLDTSGGRSRGRLPVIEPGTQLWRMADAALETLVGGAEGELVRPSGLELHEGLLYVADNATSRITAFTLAGERVDWLDTGMAPGSLMGMAFDPQGRLYVVDGLANRLLRISAK